MLVDNTAQTKNISRWKLLWILFSTFFKVGAFTFGGGYAMIPMIHREIVENQHLIDDKDIIDVLAISQSLPGAIAINSATFIGTMIAGVPGAIAATVGVILPSIIVITVIATFFLAFKDNPIVIKVFAGVKAATVALIVIAVLQIWRSAVKDYVGVIIAVIVFVLTGLFNVNAIYMILGGIAVGLILGNVKKDVEVKG